MLLSYLPCINALGSVSMYSRCTVTCDWTAVSVYVYIPVCVYVYIPVCVYVFMQMKCAGNAW